eukprot:TRINITY_DN109577_c0_g1_i1.p1 TRINITY_DN109577_c0_g1~~TRINITY_DN109577_c0_g1_i1.p1  ORF type:complete len:681 (-),score=112.07 TRINITY_DN109577_c0_g1_i1:201-2243(-)
MSSNPGQGVVEEADALEGLVSSVPDQSALELASEALDVRIWTARKKLTFPALELNSGKADLPLNLPLFLPNSSLLNTLLISSDGKQLKLCPDSVYEALDHRLFWLHHNPSKDIFHFHSPENSKDAVTDEASWACVQTPEEVLLLADFFRDPVEDILSRWELRAESEFASTNRVSAKPLDNDESGDLPKCGPVGKALNLDTAAGYVALVRPLAELATRMTRIHARVHFFDDGVDRSALGHWMGLKSSSGSASIGLAFGIDGCYSYLSGAVPDGKPASYHGWQRTEIERRAGWHLFELIIEACSTVWLIDGECVSNLPCNGMTDGEDELWIVSRCGGIGVWAGVELFCTPPAKPHWDMGVQSLTADDRLPWEVCEEAGRWQLDYEGVMQSIMFCEGTCATVTPSLKSLMDSFARYSEEYGVENGYCPGMNCMLGNTYAVVSISDLGMIGLQPPGAKEGMLFWFPPVATALTAALPVVNKAHVDEVVAVEIDEPAPETAPVMVVADPADETPELEEVVDVMPREPFKIGGLEIECWNIPGEEDLARMERVMSVFTKALEKADVAMPDNIRRIQQCKAAQHKTCHVYSFGTQKMHVAARVTAEGRLLLVVRVGGGFMDFIEFARRHGSMERLRVQRQADANGREVVRITSVLSQGKKKVIPGVPGNKTPSRPPSRAKSKPSRLA